MSNRVVSKKVLNPTKEPVYRRIIDEGRGNDNEVDSENVVRKEIFYSRFTFTPPQVKFR